MMREARTPLILWICAAICVHFVFGGAGVVVADIHDDRVYLHHLASHVRDRVRSDEATFEVGLDPTRPAPPEPPKVDPPKPKPVVEEKPKPAPKLPELAKNEKKKQDEKKEEKKKTAIVLKDDSKQKPLPPPPPAPDHRIAV